MALGDRKIPEVFNKKTGGSKDARSITSERELEIKAEYDAGVHVADDGMFNTIAPALYAIQKLSEDIDELRRYITAEITSITSSQASAITANTAKRTSPTWVPSSNPSYLTSSSTQSKYLRSDADDYFSGKLNWNGSDYADAINMSLGNINDAHYVDANEYRQRASGMPRNNLGDPTVTEMALFEEQFGPKTTLANDYDNLSDLTFWGQETSSSDWVEITSYSDDNKRKFLRTNNSSVIIPSTYYKFRVEFTAKSYTFANAMYMYWSSNSHNTQVHIWKKRCSDGTWLQHTSATNTISSWPGHGWSPFSNIPWHETNTTSTGHFTDIRVEFTPNWSTGSNGYRDINLYGMQIWGGYPKGRRTPHYYDQNGEFNFLKSAHILDGHNLNIGTGNDLQIYHNGSNSVIAEVGTGDLYIKASNNLILESSTGENYFQGTANSAVSLYYDNVIKFQTTSAGVNIVGNGGGVGFIGTDHIYTAWYPGGLSSGRKAYMGYAGGGHTNFTLANEVSGADINFVTNSGTVNITGNLAVTGTIDSRDVAADGTKLDGISTGADVTPSWVPSSDPNYLTSYTETNLFLGDGGTLTTAPGYNRLIYTGQISNGVSGLFAATNNANSVITLNRHNGNYDSQLGFSSNGKVYYRTFSGTAINTTLGWGQLLITDTNGNIVPPGTVDGRDIATDGTKLDTIATNADVTPSWVPSSDPGYGTSNLALGTTSTTALAGDTVTITTAQAAILNNLANLPTRRGASGTFWNNRGMVAVS